MKKFYNRYCANNIPFHTFSTIAILLIVGSFFVPPLGVVDGSVLASVGEIFAFASLWTVIKAIDKGIDAKLSKGDISIEIDNDEKNDEES